MKLLLVSDVLYIQGLSLRSLPFSQRVQELHKQVIEKLKETLADASIKKLEQEEAKKAAVQMYNEEIKGYKLTIKDAADKLKSKSTYVKEPCYKLIDQQTRQVGYYTKEGTLVYQRAARHDELQPNIFKLAPKTGTDDK